MQQNSLCLYLFLVPVLGLINFTGSSGFDFFKSSNIKELNSEEGQNVDKLAISLCKNSKKSVSMLNGSESLMKLIAYFEALPSGHKLQACKARVLDSLEMLNSTIHSANDDACGKEKLAAMEHFHRHYISKLYRPKERKALFKRTIKIPRMVRDYFMLYAARLSYICEKAALVKLSKLKEIQGNDYDYEAQKELEENLLLLAKKLGFDVPKSYGKIFLVWNLVDSLMARSNEKQDKLYLSQDREAESRINIQTSEANNLVQLQSFCKSTLRPVYRDTLLPVLRLIDMGYYPARSPEAQSDSLISGMTDEVWLRRLYMATQICESLLPVRPLLNPSIKPAHFEVLSIAEAEWMVKERPECVITLAEGEEMLQVGDLSALVSANELERELAQQVAQSPAQISSETQRLNEEVKARRNVYGRLLRVYAGDLKRKAKTLSGRVAVIYKDDRGKIERQTLDSMAKKVNVDQLDQVFDVGADSRGQKGELVRRKRGIVTWLGSIIDRIAYIVVTAAWAILNSILYLASLALQGMKIILNLLFWPIRMLFKPSNFAEKRKVVVIHVSGDQNVDEAIREAKINKLI